MELSNLHKYLNFLVCCLQGAASSDTVAPTLVFIFYELALHHDQQEKLHAESASTDIYDRKALRSLPHLNGVINESLRIHPPVPTGGYRQSLDCGMTVAGQYIPGRTTIVAPRYTLGKRVWYSLFSSLTILTLQSTPRFLTGWSVAQWKAASSKPKTSFQSAGTANQRWSRTNAHSLLLHKVS